MDGKQPSLVKVGLGASAARVATLALLTCFVLPACQPAMSIEEARQVTASFEGQSFVPPPRTIEDILRMLDEQTGSETDFSARYQSDMAPPSMTDAWTLGHFYYNRAQSARKIGRIRQAIDDLSRATEHLPPGSIGYRMAGQPYNEGLVILLELADVEAVGGDYRRAMAHYERGISAVGTAERGTLFAFYGPLARLHAATGDLRAAEAILGKLIALRGELYRWRNVESGWIASYDAMVDGAQAEVEELRGRFRSAEALWRGAIAALRPYRGLPAGQKYDAFRVRLAACLLRQGRLTEAEVEARTLLRAVFIARGRYSDATAELVTLMARILREQGRFADAETLARVAIEIHEKLDLRPASLLEYATPRRELAATLVAQHQWAAALREYETLRDQLRDAEMFERLTERDPNFGVSLLKAGRIDEAVRTMDRALQATRRTLGDRHVATAELRALLAIARATKGDRAQALRELAAATTALLDRSVEVDDEENPTQAARDQRLAWILAEYVGLLKDVEGTPLASAVTDVVGEAFRLADVARGRSVQRALDASAARNAARTPELAELVRREQDARKQLGALYGLLATAASVPTAERRQNVEDLQARIVSLRQAREALTAQIVKGFPSYAQLVNPAPATIAQARGVLRPGEALIVTHVADQRTFVWAVRRDGPVAFAAAPLGRSELEVAVTRLREALNPSARTLEDIPEFDVAGAHALYQALLEPVRSGWEEARSLVVVTHGPLGHLPFTLLPTRPAAIDREAGPLFAGYRAVPWLARTHAVTTLPSVSSLVTLRTMPPGDPRRRPFVGFGDPVFSAAQVGRAAVTSRPPGSAASTRGVALALRDLKIADVHSARLALLPRLPDTADEILSMATAMDADPAREVFLGERANEQVVKSLDLTRYRVIAFATHGLVPGDLDGLTQPALALSAPEVANAEGDGLLTMEEILGLRLNADWVVLSACNTASGKGTGAEAISGLGRAFFYAGARALLVSSWPVETTSARALTTDLFRRQHADSRLSRAEALQQTLNALIDTGTLSDARTGRAVFSYAHPIFWAPFTLVGDGG